MISNFKEHQITWEMWFSAKKMDLSQGYENHLDKTYKRIVI